MMCDASVQFVVNDVGWQRRAASTIKGDEVYSATQ